ncbi:MAG: response regulator [Bacteroidetes bacterium]|nr:response regulator [Bacteroidota bacterium]
MNNMYHVFIVDHDPSSRHGLVRLLGAAGHNVRNYATVEDFLGSLESSVCGCLVLDADMPGKSGKELLDELNARNTDLSIIIISATDERATKRKSWEMKAEGFFRKPVDGTALIDAIEWALRSKTKNGNNTNVKSK